MGLSRMKIAGGISITVNSPMRRLPLTASFVALTQAVQFAEQIIEKYGKPEESTQFGDSFVFLRNLDNELDRASAVRNEYLLTVRLMIARQLSISGRLGGWNNEYSTIVEQLIDRMSADLRSCDPASWERLCELRKVIEDEDRFAEAVSAETIGTAVFGEKLLKVDAASLIRAINVRAGEGVGREVQTADLFGPFSGGELVFRTRDYDKAGTIDENTGGLFEKNASRTKEFDHFDATDIHDGTVRSAGGARPGAGNSADESARKAADAGNAGTETGAEARKAASADNAGTETGADTRKTASAGNAGTETGADARKAASADNARTETGAEARKAAFAGDTGTDMAGQASRGGDMSFGNVESGDSGKNGATHGDTAVGDTINVSSGDYGYSSEGRIFREDADANEEVRVAGTFSGNGENRSLQSDTASHGDGSATAGTTSIDGSGREPKENVLPSADGRKSAEYIRVGADVDGYPGSEAAETKETIGYEELAEIGDTVGNADSIGIGDTINVSSNEYHYDSSNFVFRDDTSAIGVVSEEAAQTVSGVQLAVALQRTEPEKQVGGASGQNKAAAQEDSLSRKIGSDTQSDGSSRQDVTGLPSGNAEVTLREEADSSVAGSSDYEAATMRGKESISSGDAVVGEPVNASAQEYRYGDERLILRDDASAGTGGVQYEGVSGRPGQRSETVLQVEGAAGKTALPSQVEGAAGKTASPSQVEGAAGRTASASQTEGAAGKTASASQTEGTAGKIASASQTGGTAGKTASASQVEGEVRQTGSGLHVEGTTRQTESALQSGNVEDKPSREFGSPIGVEPGNGNVIPENADTASSEESVVGEPIDVSAQEYRYGDESLILRDVNSADMEGGLSYGIEQPGSARGDAHIVYEGSREGDAGVTDITTGDITRVSLSDNTAVSFGPQLRDDTSGDAQAGDTIRVSGGDYRYDYETFVHREDADGNDSAQDAEAQETAANANGHGSDRVHVVRTGNGVTISQGNDSLKLSVDGNAVTVAHGSESVRIPVPGVENDGGTAVGSVAAEDGRTAAGYAASGGTFFEDNSADAAHGAGMAVSADESYRLADLIYRDGDTATAGESIDPITLNSYLSEGARYFAGLVSKRPMSALRATAGMATLGGTPAVMRREESSEAAGAGRNGGYGDTAQLSYRVQPHAAESEPPQTSRTVNYRAGSPSTDMLVRQFGNLIDGADPTGLTADFGSTPTQRSDAVIRELVTAVRNAAEQSAVNSKMIEEIRKKQTEMETGTLKTSDMRVISDEVITRLRTELRFDRSRYSN